MRILLITHYFPPEIGAPQARLFEMAKTWVAEGHQVVVVTGFPNHPTGVIPPEYRGKRRMVEWMDGIEVHRNWVYATPNEGFIKKTAGHISFMLSSVFQSLFRVGRPDAIVVSSPTFFSVFSAWFYSRWKRVPYVFDVRDLWPAAIVELGVLKNRLLIRILEMLELFLYRQAGHVVVVTESFKEDLVRRGIAGDKISFIPNGVDTDFFRPLPKENALAVKHGLREKFVVAYMGAHGISHALDNLLKVADRFRDNPDMLFLFVGEGATKAGLLALARDLNLPNVRFLPGQPKTAMPELWAAVDVGIVPLKRVELFKGFIPSKMFEILAAERPVVASLEGEAASILERSGGALVVPPEDVDGLVAAIRELYHDQSRTRDMGKAGREFVSRFFSRPNLARAYIEVLHRVVRGKVQ
ncbi:MAG TPA: glycosyltransferase family 4 protein [Symbiobacteriaceae bacterium]|nr:glycosyltransferase family 4 protein [Symbiobacteriaceae bacterium]